MFSRIRVCVIIEPCHTSLLQPQNNHALRLSSPVVASLLSALFRVVKKSKSKSKSASLSITSHVDVQSDRDDVSHYPTVDR